MEIESKTIAHEEAYLRQVSKEVSFDDPNLSKDISLLGEFCRTREVFALAAVQIGIPKRLIYLKKTNLERMEETDYNEERVMINPVILNRLGETTYWEACVSCLDFTGLVHRPYRIEVEYFDASWKKHQEELVGFEATVFSHEYDHLNGILHIDIAEEIRSMDAEERKEFRANHPYQILSEDGPYPVPKNRYQEGENSVSSKKME